MIKFLASEKKAYQKITDIYATAVDYPTAHKLNRDE